MLCIVYFECEFDSFFSFEETLDELKASRARLFWREERGDWDGKWVDDVNVYPMYTLMTMVSSTLTYVQRSRDHFSLGS